MFRIFLYVPVHFDLLFYIILCNRRKLGFLLRVQAVTKSFMLGFKTWGQGRNKKHSVGDREGYADRGIGEGLRGACNNTTSQHETLWIDRTLREKLTDGFLEKWSNNLNCILCGMFSKPNNVFIISSGDHCLGCSAFLRKNVPSTCWRCLIFPHKIWIFPCQFFTEFCSYFKAMFLEISKKNVRNFFGM